MQKKLKSLVKGVVSNSQFIVKILNFKTTKWKYVKSAIKKSFWRKEVKDQFGRVIKRTRPSHFNKSWKLRSYLKKNFAFVHEFRRRSKLKFKFAIKRVTPSFNRKWKITPRKIIKRRIYQRVWYNKPHISIERQKKLVRMFAFHLKTNNTYKFVYKLQDFRSFTTSKDMELRYLQFYLTPLYKKINLLYFLRLFRSFPMAVKYFDQKNVFLNSVPTKRNDGILKEGDVLFLKQPILLDLYTIGARNTKANIFSHLEYDIYSQHFCIIKGLDDLTKNDLILSTISRLKVR